MGHKILVIGAADLSDADAFLKVGCRAEDLIITELRSKEDLIEDYGEKFYLKLAELNKKGVQVIFGIDALILSKTLLSEVNFIFWGCPYFYDADFHVVLCKFFARVHQCYTELDIAYPAIGIALDCLGPDGYFNLNTRFRAFDIPHWKVETLVNLQGYYTFSPTRPGEIGRKEMPSIVTDNVLMLLYTHSISSQLDIVEKSKQPFWIDFEEKEDDNTTLDGTVLDGVALDDTVLGDTTLLKSCSYKNLFSLSIRPFSQIMRGLLDHQSINDILQETGAYYLDKKRTRWLNCLSNPMHKHPLRPTEVLKQIEYYGAHESWGSFWKTSMGGIKRPPLVSACKMTMG